MIQIKKTLIAILFNILVLLVALSAQSNKCFIMFIGDTSTNINYKNLKVNIFQKDTLIHGFINQKIAVNRLNDFDVEFESKFTKLSGLKKIKLIKDSIIYLSTKTLDVIVVKSKKSIVNETMKGFEYYPQNDSIYKDRSLLVSLQRLPFITINDEIVNYKNESKILFMINGKQRKGIGNRWSEVLKIIKAKDIYKVELVEDIPIYFKGQDYNAVINILTLDENAYGLSFNAAIILDQRKNINPNFGITLLRKKSDFSISINKSEDVTRGQSNAKTFKDNKLITENISSSKYLYNSFNFNLDYGYRIDSFKDISLNLAYKKREYYNFFFNAYNLQNQLRDVSNLVNRNSGEIDFSFINRKSKNLTKSLSLAMNLESENRKNKLGYVYKRNYDSINYQLNSSPYFWILEYNIKNSKNKNLQKEYGFQIYNKVLNQDFFTFDINVNTNENSQKVFTKEDTLMLTQKTVRPYFGLDKIIDDKKRLNLNIATEIFLVNTKINAKSFFLPSINLNYKKIVNNKMSYRYLTGFSFEKPNIDYLSPVQNILDPLQRRIGNISLIPSKYFNNSIEIVYRKKSIISNMVSIFYAFDVINFYRKYDTISKTLINFSNSNGQIIKIGNYLNYQIQLNKKLNFSARASVFYAQNKNAAFGTKFGAFTFSTMNTSRYFIGPKYGTLSFFSFINSNQSTNQGYFNGTIRYYLEYVKPLFKNKIFVTFTANNFLLKNRNVLTYTYNNNIESYTNSVTPFRLLSIRAGYNFSNIKFSKIASKKITEITGEINRAN